MSDAFDKLEGQLRRGVREIDGEHRRRPRRGWGRMSAFALAGALAVSGGALAATKIGGGRAAESDGRKLAWQAVRETSELPACQKVARRATPALSDEPPLPAITAALPALRTPAASADRERAIRLGQLAGGGAVLRRTARTIAFAGGIRLAVLVRQGAGLGAPRDPDACRKARLQRAATLSDDRPEDVGRWAQRRLAGLSDTAAGLQTLWVTARVSGGSGSSGAGTPVRPGQRLAPGVLSGGGAGHGRSVYVGVAGRHATSVLVRGRNGDRVPGAPRRVAVKQGFYALLLPSGTGPVRLRERTAAGKLLDSVALRG